MESEDLTTRAEAECARRLIAVKHPSLPDCSVSGGRASRQTPDLLGHVLRDDANPASVSSRMARDMESLRAAGAPGQ